MKVYCVMREEVRADLDHVVFATTNKDDAERFARKYVLLDYDGNPNIEVLDVEESEDNMNGSFELTLNNPLTKEDWDKIMDVELENTPSVTFKTPKGRQVKYIKADILDKIRAEIIKLQTYKMFPYEETVYIKRDEVLKIFDKYSVGSEEEDAYSD